MGNKVWDIISALAGLVAIIITIMLFFHSELRSTKQLEGVLISRTSLINPGVKNPRENLQIRYKEEPIPDVFLFQIRFRNIGRQSITKEDFSEPIKIHLPGMDRVISAEKLRATPSDLVPQITFKGNTVFVDGTLLNANDEFTIEILVIPTAGAELSLPRPSVRIASTKPFVWKPTLEAERSSIWSNMYIYIFAALTGLFVIVFFSRRYVGLAPQLIIQCDMPNQPHFVTTNAVLHCPNNHVFCRAHNLDHCPICAEPLV